MLAIQVPVFFAERIPKIMAVVLFRMNIADRIIVVFSADFSLLHISADIRPKNQTATQRNGCGLKRSRERHIVRGDVVRVTGLEPARGNSMEPKSIASANSAIPAYIDGASLRCTFEIIIPRSFRSVNQRTAFVTKRTIFSLIIYEIVRIDLTFAPANIIMNGGLVRSVLAVRGGWHRRYFFSAYPNLLQGGVLWNYGLFVHYPANRRIFHWRDSLFL